MSRNTDSSDSRRQALLEQIEDSKKTLDLALQGEKETQDQMYTRAKEKMESKHKLLIKNSKAKKKIDKICSMFPHK